MADISIHESTLEIAHSSLQGNKWSLRNTINALEGLLRHTDTATEASATEQRILIEQDKLRRVEEAIREIELVLYQMTVEGKEVKVGGKNE